jgi:hypothetical protein
MAPRKFIRAFADVEEHHSIRRRLCPHGWTGPGGFFHRPWTPFSRVDGDGASFEFGFVIVGAGEGDF